MIDDDDEEKTTTMKSAVASTNNHERALSVVAEFRDVLVGLRAQNLTLIRQGEDRQEVLEAIRRAAEKTAARCFWIALPVYLAVLGLLTSIVIGVIVIAAMAGRPTEAPARRQADAAASRPHQAVADLRQLRR
jgi:hypothetical protein